jgi:hypothetical protein
MMSNNLGENFINTGLLFPCKSIKRDQYKFFSEKYNRVKLIKRVRIPCKRGHT